MREVLTAAELERMTPAEHQAHLDASLVTDLSKVPARHLDVVRARLTERIIQAPAQPLADQALPPDYPLAPMIGRADVARPMHV